MPRQQPEGKEPAIGEDRYLVGSEPQEAMLSDEEAQAGVEAASEQLTRERQGRQAGQVRGKLDDAARQAIREATPEELATEFSLERLSLIAEQRLMTEVAELGGSLPQSLHAKLERVERALDELKAPIRQVLRAFVQELNELEEDKRTMGSLEENVRLVSALQRMLTAGGERLCCPNCDSPGTLRCNSGTSPDGAFVFSHGRGESKAGRLTCGGWSRLPVLSFKKRQ